MLLLIFFSLILSHANLGKRLSHALSLQSVATQSHCKKINSKCTTKIIFGLTTNGHEYFRAYKVISENSWLKPQLFVVKQTTLLLYFFSSDFVKTRSNVRAITSDFVFTYLGIVEKRFSSFFLMQR